jgi:Zn-dependent peptidase ImmA (M78 family)
MSKMLKSAVVASRRLLGNPYAHIEYLEEMASEEHATNRDRKIAESRLLLQNPYAYLDGKGNFNAVVGNDSAKPRYYSDRDIEERVTALQIRLWKERASLWNGIIPDDPIDVLDPAIALRIVGYQYELAETLGQYRSAGRLVEVAGLIDPLSKTVRISGQFPLSVQTFTAAHELGHALLHEIGRAVHRDRPMDGTVPSREKGEWEADKFATYFLMPAKLVRARFVGVFKTEHFYLNEEARFALSGSSSQDALKKGSTLRDLSRKLASIERYDGQQFVSLAKQFRVSVEAMAIRLEELELLAV